MTIACNPHPIRDEDRSLYQHLSAQLRAAVAEVRKLSDGCTLTLNHDAGSLVEAAQWISLERQCCPFPTFQLKAGGEQDYRLILRGPAGIKAILREEFIA